MMKLFFPGLLLLLLIGPGLEAQTAAGGSVDAGPALRHASPAPGPGADKKKDAAAQAPQGPTIIDSDAMDYDGKTRIAIFTGTDYGVFVKDPSFTVNCDKLTAYMHETAAVTTGTSAGRAKPPAAKPSPASSPAATGTPARANGLQRAIAEGTPDRPVVIVQDKPAANGEQPEHDVGIAAKADYNADTGEVVLTGWPRVSQGINTQIATSPETYMIMYRDSKKMRTIGPSRVTIQQEDQPKKTGTSSASPDGSPAQSPAPSPQ
jgi:lipopolysaccharide export system protein LptA